MKILFRLFIPLVFVFTACVTEVKGQEVSDTLRMYLKEFNYSKAIEWIDRQEKTKQYEFEKAMCYKALGDNRKSTLVLEALVEEYPDDITLKTELAKCYEVDQRWQGSAYYYGQLMEMDSTNLYFAIKKAESELNNKNIAEAKNELQKTLRADTLAGALRLLARSYELENNLDTAAYYYALGWERDSTDVFFAAKFVNTCFKKKEYLAALASSLDFIKRDTTSNQMNFLYGYSLYALENYELSRDVLQKCFSKGDSSLVTTRALGMSYYFLGDSENSYKYLFKAYEQDTTNNTVLHHLAVSASDIKKYDEAALYFEKTLYRLIPSQMQLYTNYRGLAIAFEELGEYYKAAQCYEKAIENATQDQAFYLLEPLAHLYYEHLNRKHDALDYYRQYYSTLDGKILNMKYADDGLDHSQEIAESTAQLTELGVFIDKIREELRPQKVKEEKIVVHDSNLYIVNGVVVDKRPSINPKTLYSTKTIFNLDKASEADQAYVQIAKEKDKTHILIVEIEPEDSAKVEVLQKDSVAAAD